MSKDRIWRDKGERYPLLPGIRQGEKPMDTGTVDDAKINPKHYQANIGSLQVADAMEVFFHGDIHLSHAFKYLGRAGKKEGSSYEEDLTKAKWWIDRAIAFRRRTP